MCVQIFSAQPAATGIRGRPKNADVAGDSCDDDYDCNFDDDKCRKLSLFGGGGWHLVIQYTLGRVSHAARVFCPARPNGPDGLPNGPDGLPNGLGGA